MSNAVTTSFDPKEELSILCRSETYVSLAVSWIQRCLLIQSILRMDNIIHDPKMMANRYALQLGRSRSGRRVTRYVV